MERQRPDRETTHGVRRLECPCGTVVRSDDVDELVALAQAHAREVHQMDLTHAQALDMVGPA